MKTKQVLAGIAAFAIVGASALAAVPNVAADDTPRDYNEYTVQDEVTGVPEGLTLVAVDAKPESYQAAFELLYGEGSFTKITELEQNINVEYERIKERDDLTEEEQAEMFNAYYYELTVDLFGNQLGFYADDDVFIDFHLENENHQKVANDGSEITIVLDKIYEINPVHSDIKNILDTSEYEWEYAMLHIKDDGTREFLPLMIDGENGKAQFTVTDFSTFVPVYRAIKDDEEEVAAPKTGDEVAANMGAVTASMLGLLAIGIVIKKKARL